jgi:striatin 1/3/4
MYSRSTVLLPHCRCLQEINYLTSPQAMNPLPNRPLITNPPAPLSLPNIPPFDQIPYNGRPRKVLPEAGKEFPLLNGLSSMSGTISSPLPTGPQPILGRSSPLASVMVQQHPPLSQLSSPASTQASSNNIQDDKDQDYQSENRQTAIFRPDDAGEWKEKLRLAHEASEKARLAREFQTGTSSDPGIWDRHGEEEDEVKEDDGEVEDEETTLGGGGEGTKLWKAKRTLRKSVNLLSCELLRIYLDIVTWMQFERSLSIPQTFV